MLHKKAMSKKQKLHSVPRLATLASVQFNRTFDDMYMNALLIDMTPLNNALISMIRSKDIPFLNTDGNRLFHDMLLRELEIHANMDIKKLVHAQNELNNINNRHNYDDIIVYYKDGEWHMSIRDNIIEVYPDALKPVSLRSCIRAYFGGPMYTKNNHTVIHEALFARLS